jgi:hypothetical protein
VSKTKGRKFEEKVGGALDEAFSDYKIQPQKTSTSTGKRPDFVLNQGRTRLVVDAKWTTQIVRKHVDQVATYKGHPFYAKTGALVCPENAKVSPSVEAYAEKKRVELVEFSGEKKKKEREPGLLGFFKPKKYLR